MSESDQRAIPEPMAQTALPERLVVLSAPIPIIDSSVLRIVSEPVLNDSGLEAPLAALRRAFWRLKHAHGIAAIQIGIPLRVALVNVRRSDCEETVLINPIIISTSGRLTTRDEGCLSLPGYKCRIARKNKIRVRYEDLTGVLVERVFRGYEAAVVAHEVDHMNGVLYWDRCEESPAKVELPT